MTIWHLDPDTLGTGGGTFDPTHPLDFLLMRSPDGTVWQMAVDNTGAWATGSALLLTEQGDPLLTEAGQSLLVEV